MQSQRNIFYTLCINKTHNKYCILQFLLSSCFFGCIILWSILVQQRITLEYSRSAENYFVVFWFIRELQKSAAKRLKYCSEEV